MRKTRPTTLQILTESQELMNAALREFNRKAAIDLPIFKARVAAFGEAMKRAAR